MFFIKKIRPCLNTQSDSIRAKLLFNLSLFKYIFYVLSPRTVYIKLSNFILFSLENDDMELSKRCVQLFSLGFIIRWVTKSILTRETNTSYTARLGNVLD